MGPLPLRGATIGCADVTTALRGRGEYAVAGSPSPAVRERGLGGEGFPRLQEHRSPWVDLPSVKEVKRFGGSRRARFMNDPGPGQRLGVLQYARLAVVVDRSQSWIHDDRVGSRAGKRRGGHHVPRGQQIEERRAQAAREDVGVVVVLRLAVRCPQERVEAGQVDGVVPLNVEQPVQDGPVVHSEPDSARIGEALGVGEAARIRAVTKVPERTFRFKTFLEEARGWRRRVVCLEIDREQSMDTFSCRVFCKRLLAGDAQIGEGDADQQDGDHQTQASAARQHVEGRAGQQDRDQHEDRHDPVGQMRVESTKARQQPEEVVDKVGAGQRQRQQDGAKPNQIPGRSPVSRQERRQERQRDDQ